MCVYLKQYAPTFRRCQVGETFVGARKSFDRAEHAIYFRFSYRDYCPGDSAAAMSHFTKFCQSYSQQLLRTATGIRKTIALARRDSAVPSVRSASLVPAAPGLVLGMAPLAAPLTPARAPAETEIVDVN
jgi:hypothetical protein